MHVTGIEFKDWATRNNIRPEKIAIDLGVTAGTVHAWFRLRGPVALRNLLALQAKGYPTPAFAGESKVNALG